MPTWFEKLPDAPVLLVCPAHGGGEHHGEMVESIAEITAALDAQVEPIYLLMDLRQLKLSLDDLVQAATLSARGKNALLHHPQIIANWYIVDDPLVVMAVHGLNTATFGLLRTRFFDSVDEALDYCNHQVETAAF